MVSGSDQATQQGVSFRGSSENENIAFILEGKAVQGFHRITAVDTTVTLSSGCPCC